MSKDLANVVQHFPTGNIQGLEVVGNQLQTEFGDELLAIQTFTLDPDAAGLADQSIAVRNETGGTLNAGDLVFTSGWNVGTGEFLVSKASAPPNGGSLAQFVMRTSLTTASSGFAFKSFTLIGQNTLGSVVGDPVFLDETPGGFTLTEPAFAQQIVGRVAVVSATIGEVEFLLLPDSDSGFIRSNPEAGEFPIAGLRRDATGNLEVEFDDVAV